LEAGNRLSISEWMKERPKEERRNERKMKSKVITLISAILIAVLVAIPLVGAQSETSYSFTLMGPNVSQAEMSRPPSHVEAGDLIRLTGSGTFDTTGAVSGGGSFEHIKFDGTVHSRGVWTVKEFVSFDSYGGPHPGKQGGLLKIIVEATSTWSVHWDITGPEKFIFMFIVTAPDEGVTVWGGPSYAVPVFGIVVSGRTLFHLNE